MKALLFILSEIAVGFNILLKKQIVEYIEIQLRRKEACVCPRVLQLPNKKIQHFGRVEIRRP